MEPQKNGHEKQPYEDIEILGAESKIDLIKREELEIEHANEKKSLGQLWKEYPKCVFCIVGNEFCERFSYYGMRTILTLYFINILNFDQTTSSALYHAFIVLCYFSPILGSILADGYIGKYHTIMWVSLFYASGNVVLSIAAVFAKGSSVHPYLDFAGLIIIGLGTGGIKPCVSAFGGDQFKKGQEKQLESFFSVFYFSINAGSFVSTILTPILRVQSCNGADTCYSLAFGVPAILMVTAVIFFAAGTPLYKRYKSKENVLAEFVKVQWHALMNKRTFKHIKRDYWLDHYLDDHDCKSDPRCIELGVCQKALFIEDVRAVLRVFVMYIPLPFFWMLYDQQGDRWTEQACVMNGKMNNVTVLPDQMGALNTIMVMAFIPLFDGVIYPLVDKCVKLTYLRKMCAGLFLASAAFVVCAVIQAYINKTLPVIPNGGTDFLTTLNYIPNCNLVVKMPDYSNGEPQNVTSLLNIPPTSNYDVTNATTYTLPYHSGNTNLTISAGPGDCAIQTQDFSVPISNRGSTFVVVTNRVTTYSQADLAKSLTGEGQYKIALLYAAEYSYYLPNTTYYLPNATIDFAWCDEEKASFPVSPGSGEKCQHKNADHFVNFSTDLQGGSDYEELLPKSTWYLYVKDPKNPTNYVFTNVTSPITEQGGIYLMTIYNADSPTTASHTMYSQTFQVAQPNTFSIWWQVPQYVVISTAEILFSITGYVFSFTQAPLTMKSVIMAAWLVTDAIGNLIIIFIIEINFFDNQVFLYLLFAGIMFVVTIIFVLMSMFYYEYVSFIPTGNERTDNDKD